MSDAKQWFGPELAGVLRHLARDRWSDETGPEAMALSEAAARIEALEAKNRQAKLQASYETDVAQAAIDRVKELEAALAEVLDTLDAADAEPEKAEKAGRAWSSAPAVRALYARKAARTALSTPDSKGSGTP